MKRYNIFLLLTALVLSLFLASCTEVGKGGNSGNITGQGSANNDGQTVNELITVLQSTTDQQITGFYHNDYNLDGTLEAYAITSATAIPEGTEHSGGLSFWFIKKDKVELLLNGHISTQPSFFEYPDKILTCIDVYTDGKPESNVYFVSKNHAHSYGTFGARLVRSSDDPYQFYLYRKDIDAAGSFTGETFWGESEKPYYLYFDGNFFAEYGGKPMREDQLRALNGADTVLSAISDGGYKIDSVYYRENGIINVNISRNNGNGTVRYENVTLLLKNGAVRLVPRGKNGNPTFLVDNTSLADEIISEKFSDSEAFSYHGTYKQELLPEIAVYPETVEMLSE